MHQDGDVILWEHTYGWQYDDDWLEQVLELEDGSLVVIGSLNDSASNEWGWIMKLSVEGDSIWSRAYSYNGSGNQLWGIQKTKDKGFVLCGVVYQGESGTQDMWLLKTDSLGCVAEGCALVEGLVIPELHKEAFVIVPNPFNSETIITLPVTNFDNNPGSIHFKLYDIQGKQVHPNYTVAASKSSIKIKVNRSNLPAGNYYFTVKPGSNTIRSGMIITH